MAHKTEAYYAMERGKKHQHINIKQKGRYIPKNQEVTTFLPEADGVTFHLKVDYTDSLGQNSSANRSSHPIKLHRISGPAEIINDTTFRLKFNRTGFIDRRAFDIEFMAAAEVDDTFRRGWRRVALVVPYRLTEGTPQRITFPEIEDVKAGTASIVEKPMCVDPLRQNRFDP